jgi:hypothetical protein
MMEPTLYRERKRWLVAVEKPYFCPKRVIHWVNQIIRAMEA